MKGRSRLLVVAALALCAAKPVRHDALTTEQRDRLGRIVVTEAASTATYDSLGDVVGESCFRNAYDDAASEDEAMDQVKMRAVLADADGVVGLRCERSGLNMVKNCFAMVTCRGEAVRFPAAPEPSADPLRATACATEAAPLPGGLEASMEAVVVIETLGGVGSGLFISPDGYVATAAHVVDRRGEITVKTRSGVALPAEVVRLDPLHDVALLRIPGKGYPCLRAASEASIGAEVYAIGAPGGADLAYSVSRGIVSGRRDWDGRALLQTDASLSPGNSGGPLLDASGRVLAIVSFKIAGTGYEGLAFGVPMDAVIAAAGVEWQAP